MHFSLARTAFALATLSLTPLAHAAGTEVTGDAAASLIDAMMHSGIEQTVVGTAHWQLRADRISCAITGATGGEPACVVEHSGGKLAVSMDDAPGTWIALSKTGRVQGGAHSGRVSVEAAPVVCDIYLEQLGADGRMPARICTL